MHHPVIRIATIFAVSGLLLIFIVYGQRYWVPVVKRITRVSVQYVIGKYGEEADKRLAPHFQSSGISYPPKSIKLLALKEEKVLEVWAENDGEYKWIKNYKIKAASGSSGPKLVEHDGQVPEGFYKIIGYNPNSSYHLSMKLNYPNNFDKKMALAEGRARPGNNIFIHGDNVSIGCLAMGDTEIEELFTLVYRVGKQNVDVIIAPIDPRKHILKPRGDAPRWVAGLYERISNEFSRYNSRSLKTSMSLSQTR